MKNLTIFFIIANGFQDFILSEIIFYQIIDAEYLKYS